MTQSYSISKALGLNYEEFNLEAIELPPHKNKWGGVEGERRPGVGGGATTTGRIFITNGVIEKIVDPNGDIPPGFKKGRVRKTKNKGLTLNGVQYSTHKEAAEALGVSKAMITYLKKKEEAGGKRPW